MHWMFRNRVLILAGICVVCTGIIILCRQVPSVPFFSTVWRSEQPFQDLMRREGRKTATKPDFVFIGIDQGTLEMPPLVGDEVNNRAFQLMTERSYQEGWSREIWALFLDRVFGAGARLVMFDMVFNKLRDENLRAGDEAFAAALNRYRDKVVLAANFDFSEVSQVLGGSFQTVVPHPLFIPAPQMQDDRVGYVTFFPDRNDQKIRAVWYTITDKQLARDPPQPYEVPYESLSARALGKLGRSGEVPRDLQAHLIRFSALDAYDPRPLYHVFDKKLWHSNFNDGAFFKDKVIVVGASAQIM